MPWLQPTPGNLPYAIVHAANGYFACFGNGAVRRIGNHEVVFLRDEQQVRTYRFDGDFKIGSTTSKALFNI